MEIEFDDDGMLIDMDMDDWSPSLQTKNNPPPFLHGNCGGFLSHRISIKILKNVIKKDT